MTREKLKELLFYSKQDGIFIWRKRPITLFKSTASFLSWNTKHENKVAGYEGGNGYVYIKLEGKSMKAHRLAWLYVYGTAPLEIDHKNRIRSDNRIKNLRSVTSAENNRNKTRRKDNKSGHTGVVFDKASKKWKASIQYKNKSYNLGSFVNKKDAISEREDAERDFNFCNNHNKI